MAASFVLVSFEFDACNFLFIITHRFDAVAEIEKFRQICAIKLNENNLEIYKQKLGKISNYKQLRRNSIDISGNILALIIIR